MSQIFDGLIEAGAALAEKLSAYRNRSDTVLVGINGEGLLVAQGLLSFLKIPLDFILVRKIFMPGCDEEVLGAVTRDGISHISASVANKHHVLQTMVSQISRIEMAKLVAKESSYRRFCKMQSLESKTVILVADGIHTGATMLAAVGTIRNQKPSKIVIATPIAPKKQLAEIRALVDDLVCLIAPDPFVAVGQCYRNHGIICDQELALWFQKSRANSVNLITNDCDFDEVGMDGRSSEYMKDEYNETCEPVCDNVRKEDWKSFLNAFSKQHFNWKVSIREHASTGERDIPRLLSSTIRKHSDQAHLASISFDPKNQQLLLNFLEGDTVRVIKIKEPTALYSKVYPFNRKDILIETLKGQVLHLHFSNRTKAVYKVVRNKIVEQTARRKGVQ